MGKKLGKISGTNVAAGGKLLNRRETEREVAERGDRGNGSHLPGGPVVEAGPQHRLLYRRAPAALWQRAARRSRGREGHRI